jgi:hypothetical protein
MFVAFISSLSIIKEELRVIQMLYDNSSKGQIGNSFLQFSLSSWEEKKKYFKVVDQIYQDFLKQLPMMGDTKLMEEKKETFQSINQLILEIKNCELKN